MNIAVVGSSGYIAKYLVEKFGTKEQIDRILKIGRTGKADLYLDLLEAEKFCYEMLKDMDYVIFTAAVSSPDQCAEDFDYCWQINVSGTVYFITESLRRGCRVLFFSSDAVFGEDQGEAYTENSETNATTPYGRMKKAVEDSFRNESEFKSLRLPYVVSREDHFCSFCLECISKQKTADIFHPFYRNCIFIHDVAQVVYWLMRNWDEYPYSVLNIAGKELISRVRIADELNRHLGNRLKYSILSPGDAFYKNRPRITQMKSLYIQQYQIIDEDSFTEKMKRELGDREDEC